jgi:hypothetical protein
LLDERKRMLKVLELLTIVYVHVYWSSYLFNIDSFFSSFYYIEWHSTANWIIGKAW